QIQALIEEIPKYQPGADLGLLARAYEFSEASHRGQQRASGEPYLSHPVEVATLLVNFKMDVTTVTAGLLHDVLEDTKATKEDLEREADINQVIAIIERKLSEVGIESQIRGRPKHFYSIWKKMHDQGREFDEIYDLTAVRVITMSVRDCYGALGVIHSLWKPVPG